MIPMAVGDQNVIRFEIVRRTCRHGITGEKRIYEERMAIRLDEKRGMAEPRQFAGHGNTSSNE
jgi:hypothetical protein